MNAKRLLLALFAAVLFTVPAQAITDSHRAAIERLFTVMKTDKQYEISMIAGFEAGVGMTEDRLASLPEDQRVKIKAALAKAKAKMVELMGWDKIKGDMIELYGKHFTEAEIKDITKMMETPIGQKLVTEQIALVPEAMTLSQAKAKLIMPQIIQVIQDGMK